MAKKKKVTVYKMPKAQEGMQMAAEAPQEQQAGADQQMQQLAQQVQQMLEQGADPAQVVAQLVQGGVPPQVVAQILVGLGMPQEQVMPMIEQVMQQMQGAQQQGPPQENGETEGQPMMEYGDEVFSIPNPIFGKKRKRMLNAAKSTVGFVNDQNYLPYNPDSVYAQALETLANEEARNASKDEIVKGMSVRQSKRMLKDGGGIDNPGFKALPAEVQNKIVSNMQQGGEAEAMQQMVAQIGQALQEGANPQEVIAQLLQNTGNSEVVKQLMAAATGADEQTAMEQINPMVDQVAQMNGGQIDEAMMGAINPTKDDFLKLKKKMLKEMKAGGTTKGFDSSSTESYVQNLQGAISNHVAKNLRVGIINQQFDKVMQEFDSLPKAKEGFETWAKKNIKPGTDLSTMDPALLTQLKEVYNLETGSEDKTEGAENLDESVIDKKSDENKNIDQTIQDAIDNQMRHYFPGGNMYNPDYYDRSIGGRMVRRFGDPRAVTRENTGNYDFTGMGELSGKTGEEAISRIEEVLADPNYAKRIQKGYINRRGKFKKGPGIFNQRPFSYQIDYAQNQYLPVTDKLGTRSEDLEFDSEQTDGETNTQTQQQSTIQGPFNVSPIPGITNQISLPTRDQLSPFMPQPVIDEKGRIRTPNETDESLYAQGESDLTAKYINEGMNPRMAARKAKREIALQNPELAGVEERLSRKEQKLANDPYYGKTAQEIYQLVDDPKKAKKLVEKYGAPLESRGVEVLPESELRKDRMNVDVMSKYYPQQLSSYWKSVDDDYQKRLASMIAKDEYGSKKIFGMEGMSESDILNSRYEDRNKGLIRDYGMNAPLYYPEYFKQHGGLVSNPGRPIWDFKEMKWSSPKPAQSLLFAENGLEMLPVETIDEVDLSNTPLLGYDQEGNSVVQGEDGGFRFSEQRKKIVDRKKRGQNIFNTASFINDMILEPAAYLTTSEEAAAERQKMIRPTDVKSGAMGFYNQFGDPRFGQTGNLSAGVRSGTGTDQDVYGQFSNYNLYNDLMTGQTRLPFFNNGGLVEAQLGLQVGDEIELSERDIMELAKYGYEITRM
jgi:hypothetical protein